MANMTFSKKSLYDFIKSNPSLQLQANFEFRWPLVFNENSFLIDTLEIPEVDSTQGYMYLDGYQIPVLGTPRFTNAIRLSFWAEEPFFKKYELLFNELKSQKTLNAINQDSSAYLIPVSTEETHSIANNDKKSLRLYDTKLKQISVDEHNASSQALVHINLTIAFGAFDVFEQKISNSNSRDSYLASSEWDYAQSEIVNALNSALNFEFTDARRSLSDAQATISRAGIFKIRSLI